MKIGITSFRPLRIGAFLMAFLLASSIPGSGRAEKVTLGRVEEVILLPWGARLRAKIDTGAQKSSLHATEITAVASDPQQRTQPLVRFSTILGGKPRRLEAPLLGHAEVKATEGPEEVRPVVAIAVCIDGIQKSTPVTLNDRSHLQYKMIIGRETLAGEFVVDVEHKLLTRPECTKDR